MKPTRLACLSAPTLVKSTTGKRPADDPKGKGKGKDTGPGAKKSKGVGGGSKK